MAEKYILVNGEPQVEPNLLKWAEWFENSERHLKQDVIGNTRISTVFLGLDHSFGGGPPVLWETMIFDGPEGLLDETQWRYTSQEDALAGHENAVGLIKASMRKCDA